MPQPITRIGKLARRAVVHTLCQSILRIPGICPPSAGEGVAIGIVRVICCTSSQQHVRGVVSIVLRQVVIGLLEAVTHTVEGVGLSFANIYY